MSLLWVSGFVSIFGGFLLGMFFGSGSGPGLFGLGAGREVGLFFPWKKQLAALRHLFSGGKNNPTPRPANYQGIVGERQQQKNEERKKQSINSRYAFSGVNRAWGGATNQGPTSGAGSGPSSRNSEADFPVHLRNARLKFDKSA